MLNNRKIKIVLYVFGIFIAGCSQNTFSTQKMQTADSKLQIIDSNSELGTEQPAGTSEPTVEYLDRSLTSPASLSGITYYVCNSGSVCGSGWATGSDSRTAAQAKSKLTPWKTIDHAENQAKPGDLIIVGSGIYNTPSTQVSPASNGGIIYIKKSGASGKPISIKSEKKWGAIIDATGTTHSGIYIQCDTMTSHIRIDGFEIRNPNYVGVNSKDAIGTADRFCSNIELTNLKIHHFGHAGISLESTKNSMIASNVIYTLSTLHSENNPNHNQFHGVYLSDLTEDILLKNTIIYDVRGGWPVHIYDGHGKGPAKNHKVINNTLIMDNPYRAGGIVMFGTSHVIRNNLIYNRAKILNTGYKGAISDKKSGDHSSSIIQNNITNLSVLCQNGCLGASIGGNLLSISTLASDFVSLAGLNFQLRSTAKAVNKGTLTGFGTRSGAPTDDFLNKKRYLGSSVDVGAHESY